MTVMTLQGAVVSSLHRKRKYYNITYIIFRLCSVRRSDSQRQDTMEVTALHIRLLLLLLTAEAQNSNYVHKADAAFLHIDPNRLQFFEYESISLHCVAFDGPTDWRVMRNIPSNTTPWETSAGRLFIKPAFIPHSGEYWCENGDGERSNTVNITVTAGDVILESPAVPQMEQQTVTLQCSKRATSSNCPADFFKDGRFYKTGYTGKVSILSVSKSDEGLYKCKISGSGESAESQLTVGVLAAYITSVPQSTTSLEGDEETPPQPSRSSSFLLCILLTVVFAVLCVVVLLLVLGLLQRQKHKVTHFTSEIPTTESEQVYECMNYTTAAQAGPQMPTYATVKKPKKNKDCHETNEVDHMRDVLYTERNEVTDSTNTS